MTPSAIVDQQPAIQGTMPDIVDAYGEAVATAATSKALTLPFEGSFVSIEVMKGQSVRAGQRLASFAPSPAATVALTQARTAVTAARVQRERIARLLAGQLSTRDQLAQADKSLADARAQLAAQDSGVSADGTVALRAPFDGTVLAIGASRGDIVQAGVALFAIVATDGLTFTGGLEARDIDRVHGGDASTLIPVGGGPAVPATVTRVGDALDSVTRQAPVALATSGHLVPGMSYRAAITVGTRSGWILPAGAIVGEDTKRHVFQVDHGRARSVPVTVIIERDGQALVSGELDPAQPLVTVGATQLDDGMEVRPMGKR